MTKKVAIVTGAGSGIGKSVTLALLQAGYAVALAGRRRAVLEQTIAEAKAGPENALAVETDITQPDEVRELFQQTKDTFGRLDLLFNNAGINIPAVPLETVTFEQLTSVLDTNILGAFLCTQEAIKLMKNQDPMGGRIINNGSISATTPRPHSAPYTASKHAMTGLTKSTALDGRKYRIACGQIDIGNASTEMTGKMGTGVLQPNGESAPEPTMNVDRVAEAVLYMAGLPLEANVLFITVMATNMPFVGRG
ncbi:SDR family oxidoreductase [Flavilitoribacter nigricans]|uniref:3-oxoacyl-ACP reductase n=1 Tax=Flavilitoribacter nigricans (strain ATCC 23147 / DSM 23189 / NBRC 102662 / NCIMB 1420 / SS-2) TaxID=1122177 RepID=A0A2D0N8Y8_FLAN2|nr:SDR family oxidoreductase [Flavilitoribacter nigricans]PHN04981.1 3-oxoacyl-ACP reductase [Flavilitoribacter nigricans DSM 23189 = NBRC 102662]